MFDASWWHEVFAKHSRTSDNHFKKNVIMLHSNGMEKSQLPMITFLLIFKIQLYFVHSFSRNKSPEKCLIQT